MAKKKKVFKTMDGNEAAAYVSYAFTEVATIYPITPSSPMADHVDEWAANGKKNLFGQPVKLMELQAESGACGAMHGALETGSLATTYTASQGLMLMIPPMYRIAGSMLPGVMHVSARTVGTHSISIFGDHSDAMACRQTGFAQLCSSSVQECMDMAAVAHLSAIKGSIPFMHFFDGFRTSHEIQKIEVLDYEDLGNLLDWDAVQRFKDHALSTEHPTIRSTLQNPDTFFQSREACNTAYNALPAIVEDYMKKINKLTGRNYQLFNYYGAPDATRVVIAMGSVCETLTEVVDYLRARGEKVGFIQVHLYRPFSLKHLLKAIPATAKTITVLDRTKEPGAMGEPLYEDVCTAIAESKFAGKVKILGGRYGLSSKDTTPAQMKAVFDNMKSGKKNHFTVGIEDDVTFTSLPVGENIVTAGKSIISCKFWGLGSDGTVGANKNSIKIIGDNTDQYAQAYFEYDSKKSGGVTKSHLRFGHEPIRSTYYVTMADFVACHKESYIKTFDIVSEIKEGGTFLLNTSWKGAELEEHLPNKVKRIIAQRNIKFYTIDATEIATELGLGNRTNTVLQAAFFKLSGVLPIEEAVGYMKQAIVKSYSKKGQKVVDMNCAAVDRGVDAVVEIAVPASWKDLQDEPVVVDESLPRYIREIQIPVNNQAGDTLPVSVFMPYADGVTPVETSKYEKRGIATDVPRWIPENCIGCNQCSLVCPHACIRPFLFTEEEAAAAPAGLETKKAMGKGFEKYTYRLQVDPLDCQGCGSCANVCPAKNKALVMEPLESQMPEQANWDYCLTLSEKANPMDKFTVKGSQFERPLYEFNGSCAGCGEAPYMKLMTQLFGDRMYIADATGCTYVVGSSTPAFPYATNSKGHGPAPSNSLFENNAEYSLGMCLSVEQMRNQMKAHAQAVVDTTSDAALKAAVEAWLAEGDIGDKTRALSEAVVAALDATADDSADVVFMKKNKDVLPKKSMWMYGGDGWAYDIGYGGLDHVLASGLDVNVLVVDTEVYSNTGGQASKATQIGAVAQFANAGKATAKKDLGAIAMTYGNIYVAQVAMGANPGQLITALKEAEAHKGPSLIIAYAPCINHGISNGMGVAQTEEKMAVECGYWPLWRYIPENVDKGENPFKLDSKEPNGKLREFMMGETRFASLTRTFPETAERLFAEAEEQCAKRYAKYQKLAEK
ncbi:MAG: pyruvate:ferredoxin (flavodoxin) oxidoreductase [Oscillospiraceae bacterium]|nr:pyruvate:ferredoxin (flavodoxin) oxidoreductase [Oscillospiraceae bacterium]